MTGVVIAPGGPTLRELTKLAFAALVLCAGLSPSHGELTTTVAVAPSHARERGHHGGDARAQPGQHARPAVHAGDRAP